MIVYLNIAGMTCTGCVSSVRRVLQAVPLVEAVSVDLEAGRATVEAAAAVNLALLISAVEDAGYDARIDSVAGPSSP
ncbi:MAG: heavy metal-associated domain-containing protein [Hyphomicrobiales bacterium]|nr:heavy metal-associated domain-containing protein [Hyphomicrobiales bacterium]